MKEYINDEFLLKCEKDITEVLEEIKVYIPDVNPWQLNQSLILSSDKKIVCKSINENDKKIGLIININFLESDDIFYLLLSKNSLTYQKSYYRNNNLITECFNIAIVNNNIIRELVYSDGSNTSMYDEKYCLDDFSNKQLYEESKSLEVLMQKLKNSKVRKRS